jgi:hypothetical protein
MSNRVGDKVEARAAPAEARFLPGVLRRQLELHLGAQGILGELFDQRRRSIGEENNCPVLVFYRERVEQLPADAFRR